MSSSNEQLSRINGILTTSLQIQTAECNKNAIYSLNPNFNIFSDNVITLLKDIFSF